MSLNQIVASDRLRPLLEGVVEAMKPAAVSSTNGAGGTASLSIAPSIKVKPELQGVDSVRKIVGALIVDGGGDAAAPIADTISFDGMGLYFVGAGSSRNDEINFESNRSDAEAPNLYLNAREGDDKVRVSVKAPPPEPFSDDPLKSITIDAGDGNDRVDVSAAIIDEVSGGSGNDTITTSSDRVYLVGGGAGDDNLKVFSRRIDTVQGGAGDDQIIAYGEVIDAVSGGDGNDQMVIGSRNMTFEGVPYGGAPVVSGGAGDDDIAIAGRAEVEFALGDGNDQVSIGDTTVFRLSGFAAGELQFSADGNKLTITSTVARPGEEGEEPKFDSIEIESRTDQLFYTVDSETNAVTVYTSEEAFTAAQSNTSATDPLANMVQEAYRIGSPSTPEAIDISGPTFLSFIGDVTLEQGSTIEEENDGTLVTFASGNTMKLRSDSGPLIVDVLSNRTLALFQTQEQYDAWTASPANPLNRAASTDPLMAVLERINQRFV